MEVGRIKKFLEKKAIFIQIYFKATIWNCPIYFIRTLPITVLSLPLLQFLPLLFFQQKQYLLYGVRFGKDYVYLHLADWFQCC